MTPEEMLAALNPACPDVQIVLMIMSVTQETPEQNREWLAHHLAICELCQEPWPDPPELDDTSDWDANEDAERMRSRL